MLQAFEIIRHIRQRLRDTPVVLRHTISAAEYYNTVRPGTLTIPAEYATFFWPGQVVDIVSTIPYTMHSLDTFRVSSLTKQTSGDYALGYIPQYGYIGSGIVNTAGREVFLVPFDYFSNRMIVDAYNEVVLSVYRRGIYQRVTNILYREGDELSGGFHFVEMDNGNIFAVMHSSPEAEILDFYEVTPEIASEDGMYASYRRIGPWKEISPGLVRYNLYTLLPLSYYHHGESPSGLLQHGYQTYIRQRAFVIEGGLKKSGSLVMVEYLHPYNFMPYNVALYRGYIQENYLPQPPLGLFGINLPLLPAHLLRLISLGVEIICYETMLADRERFDRYTATAWNRAVTPYEVASPLRLLREEYERELRAQLRNMPPMRRTVWR